ncbi:hypothetical protein HZD78_22620 [Mycobacteroides chelonae]|uniref:hypothetical protein n=1 Tax=Mycobacteroides chelonae TaxID=1774 RepID=UPI001C43AE27|nr:hypothetical protein [Mycobacteroides chelonae]MBV6362743.1 hypothetical protein [Mycobacteroides chelonae]
MLTPIAARQAAAWCEGFGDFEAAAELRWAAGEAEKFCSEDEDEAVQTDLIMRIDDLLSVDAMSWSPMSESEKSRILAGEQDERPRPLPAGQVHVIPVDQVDEWTIWWDGLSESDRRDTPWFVVCFEHGVAGERSVACGCGNPSSPTISG